jgi:TolB protein
VAFLAGFVGTSARADIVVNVDQGATQPLPIAIPPFAGAPVGNQISQVVTSDLAGSGLFNPLAAASFPDRTLDVNAQPRFDAWKGIGAQALLTGQVVDESEGRLRVDFRLWDVYAGDELLGLQFTSTPENWRRVAHKISDAVYEKLTGAKGYFDTRIVFVAESGSKSKRVRRLEIMDQDGANPSYLTDPTRSSPPDFPATARRSPTWRCAPPARLSTCSISRRRARKAWANFPEWSSRPASQTAARMSSSRWRRPEIPMSTS